MCIKVLIINKAQNFAGAGHDTMGDVQVVTVLYKRQNHTGEEWSFVQMVPTYYSSKLISIHWRQWRDYFLTK